MRTSILTMLVVAFPSLLGACGSSSGSGTGATSSGTGSAAGASSAGGAAGTGGAAVGGASGAAAAGGAAAGTGGAAAGAGGAAAGSGGAAAGATGTGGSAGGAGGPGSGGSTGTAIMGSVSGMPFTTSTTALWLGKPDSASTEVVYVFSKPVDCAILGAPGWDTKITSDTQVLEMKVFGTAPGTFKVVKSANPATGQAVVNYTLSKMVGTPAETVGSGGTVTVTAIAAGKDITGSFALTFGADSLDGTFDAVFCPGGVEP